MVEKKLDLEEQLLLESKVGPTANLTFQLSFSIFIAVCGSFVYGCAMGFTSPVQSAVLSDLGLTTAQYSLFGSLLTIGGLLGSLVCGKITDCLGRRGTIGLADVLCLAGWLFIAFAQGSLSLDIGRIALGFASGLIGYAVPVYIAEIAPENLRGGSVLLHMFMTCCGVALTFLVGLTISWRILALIGTLPSLIQLIGLFYIPESPRWLVKVGRDENYEASLQRLRGQNVDISQELHEIKGSTTENISEDKFCDVFQMKYAYALTVTIGLMALASFSGANGVLFYATAIFESAGFSRYVGTVAMALIQLPPTAVGVILMDIYGRRPLLLCSAAGMATACLSVAISFFLKEHERMTNFSPYLALNGLLLFFAAYPVGMGGIPFVLMSEIFPINIKGAAGSLSTVVSFSTGWIVSYTFNFMMVWSSSSTFFIFAGINVFTVLFVAKLVPETKGRTLEEIQAMVNPDFVLGQRH